VKWPKYRYYPKKMIPVSRFPNVADLNFAIVTVDVYRFKPFLTDYSKKCMTGKSKITGVGLSFLDVGESRYTPDTIKYKWCAVAAQTERCRSKMLSM